MKILVLGLFLFSSKVLAQNPDPTLINGVEASKEVFKEVVRISMSGSSCTATIVGPEVIITASHCVSNGGSASFKLDGETYVGRCTRHPRYPRQDYDVALCKLKTKVENVKFAQIANFPTKEGEKITILGYGCIRPGGGGGNDGILRIGDATVIDFSSYDIVSGGKKGEAALCYGDSGGPNFRLVEDKESMTEMHYQIAVNSKGNIKDTSYTTYLQNEEAMSFLKDYAEDENVDICGINVDCTNGLKENPNCKEEEYFLQRMKEVVERTKEVYDICLKSSQKPYTEYNFFDEKFRQ